MNRNGLPVAALTTLALLLSGCVVGPADPYYYEHPVALAPPPPRQEYPGYPPMADYVWLSGYWGWGGSRYEWVPGHWEAPRPGHVWVPQRWEREGDRWHSSGGRWQADDRGRPERGNPPRREGGDGRDFRERQGRGDTHSVPQVEHDNAGRSLQPEHGRPTVAGNPVLRAEPVNGPRPEPHPVPAAAPAAERSPASREDAKGDPHGRHRSSGDER